MPTDACQFFYECTACDTLLRPGIAACFLATAPLAARPSNRMLIVADPPSVSVAA